MRITAIEPSGNLYGSEHCLLDVMSGTAERGFEWEVVLPPGGGFDELLARRRIPALSLLLPDSHTRSRARKLLSYWRVRNHIASARPDVVYLNQAGILRGATAITKGLGIPMVCQVQTLEDARLVASHPDEQKAVTAFICNSRFIASASDLPAGKTSIFYQPVIEPGPLPLPPPADGRRRIGILGRIAESKGHWIFLDAAAELIRRRVPSVEFVVIGEGIDAHATTSFRGAVASAGMSNYFDLRGFRPDVHAELSRLHLLAIPSLAEPLGRVLLDACVARRPAIVSDSGGLGEFSRRFELGRRVPANDPGALATAWADVLSDYDAECSTFSAAAARALRRLSPGGYIDAVTSVLRDAAEGRSASIEWLGDPA